MINKTSLKLDGTTTEHIVLVCKALSDRSKLEVLYRLTEGPAGVTEEGPAGVTELADYFKVIP